MSGKIRKESGHRMKKKTLEQQQKLSVPFSPSPNLIIY
jgi:hypothetical protein